MTSIGQIRRRIEKVEEKVAPEDTYVFTFFGWSLIGYELVAKDPK